MSWDSIAPKPEIRHAALIAMAASLLALQASPAAATTDYFSLSPEQLLNMQVLSVSKKRETVAKAPAAVFVITSEDIMRAGVTTLADALRMAPGVQVAQESTNRWVISIRGFNSGLSNKLLVLMDGRTLYNPLFGGTYWKLQDYLLEDVERIEVVRGPGGTLWGADAMNGVVNIITKKAVKTQGVLAHSGYGNHERGFIGSRYGGALDGGGFYRVYAKAFSRDSSKTPGGEDAPDEWDGARSGFRFDKDDSLTVQGDIYHDRSEQVFQSFPLSLPILTPEEEVHAWGTNMLGHWKQNLDDGSLLTLQSFFDYNTYDQRMVRDERFIFDLEAQYDLRQTDIHEVTAGAGFRYMMDELSEFGDASINPSDRSDPLYNVFLQDKITLAPEKWYLTLGSKLEHNHYTGFEFQPNARLQRLIGKKQSAWAAVSKAVRTPSRIERNLDLNPVTIGSGLFPLPAQFQFTHNPNFDSEKLTAYELGYRTQIRPELCLDIAAFYNDYDELISFTGAAVPQAGPPPSLLVPLTPANDESAETYGAELAVEWQVNEGWKLDATYSYLELSVHSPAVLGFRQDTEEGRAPVHQAGLRSSWDISKDWALDANVYYVDALSETQVDDYVRLDLNLGWRVTDTVRFNLTGQNLLDDAHREVNEPDAVNATEVERSVFAKVTWDF